MIELSDGLLYLGDDLNGDPIRVSGMHWEWVPLDEDAPARHPFGTGPVSIELTLAWDRQMRRQIARAFGIPAYLLGTTPRARLRRMHSSYPAKWNRR